MSKKFFSLIYGDIVRIAPKTKILPADSISTLLNAEEVLKAIKNDAEAYRLEVVKECDTLKEKAFQEGYEEGFNKWAEHLTRLENEIESVHKELQKLVIPVALKAAKKIVGRELELKEDSIVDIVASNLKAVSQHKKITIYVNKKELETLEKNKQRFKDVFENLESLSLRERDDVSVGSCMIETEVGIINGDLEHRWRILEKAFENLSKKK